ncbi:MAG: LCP family protein [Defluviitaleaceae bacterium]|nr:LCP family protein [Defluviitaleaceae bacterium]
MLKNIPIRKMFVAFSITLIAILAVAGGAYAGMRALFNPPPPTVGNYITLRPLPPSTGLDGNISLGNTNPSDGDSYYEHPPEVLTRVPRRHPYFFTLLIFATDTGNNVDAMMVASFDARENEINVISIPRDIRVDSTRGVGRRKPVASYSAGRGGGRGHEGGVAQLKRELSTLIGFEPDFYVHVDYRAFERLIDAVGGVEIDVPRRMFYVQGGAVDINIPAGLQVMDGRTASHFARYRHSITDYGRMENQQAILTALYQEMLSPSMILQLPELIRIYQENVNTDMSFQDMLWFVNHLSHMDMSGLSTYTLPTSHTVRQGWYEMPDSAGILELINRTINPLAIDITPEMVRHIQ